MLERSLEAIMAKTGRDREAAEASLLAANPQARFIEPEEVAAAVIWLCGAGAASVTGQAISISGGET
jgi:NAD(P)-dependent dehydrogenase (short-subunit alcohol dehydrogenase family)